MSSDGSVTSTSSRIRQFGLYRTIDARTDEFLRSSRRRQIRQGCACAAISTAITVTVVVSVILVYEYSINSESNVNKKITVNPNWLGLMNESDLTQIDSKFTKKINFDRTTLKLLPILLKALNKNRYLEKIIEDYSSSSPPYEKRDESGTYLKKNIFSDAKNWLKVSSPKMYTLDYKTSPLIYLNRRPSQRLDYLSNLRKIRNYERMLNYFDKMINEKVSNTKSSQALTKDFGYTESIMKAKTDPIQVNKTKAIVLKSYFETSTNSYIIKNVTKIRNLHRVQNRTKNIIRHKNISYENFNCKCPKDMGQLLSKLIQSLQELVPNGNGRLKPKISCANKTRSHKHKFITFLTTERGITTSSTQKMVTEPTLQKIAAETTTQAILTEPTTQTLFIPRKQKILTAGMTHINAGQSRKTTISPSKKLFIKAYLAGKTPPQAYTVLPKLTTGTVIPVTDRILVKGLKFESTTTTPNTNIDQMYENYETKNTDDETSTYSKYFTNEVTTQTSVATTTKQRTTTELIVPFKYSYHSREGSISNENGLDSVAIIPDYRHPVGPVIKDDQYDDYLLNTPKNTNDLANLDVHSFELVKTKNVLAPMTTKNENADFRSNMRKVALRTKPTNYHPVIKNKDIDLYNMRKVANLIYIPKPIIDETSTLNFIVTPTQESKGSKISSSVESFTSKSKISGYFKNALRIRESDIETRQLHLYGGDGNGENIGEEEEEEWVNQPDITEIPIIQYNKSLTYFNDDDNSTSSSANEETKSDDKAIPPTMNSMLPPNRPIYLEVRRNNEWKPEEHTDYDMNMANNIFDLPNI